MDELIICGIIRRAQEASNATPEDSPDLVPAPKLAQWGETDTLADIEEAIEATRTAIDLASDVPQRAKYMMFLGGYLHNKYKYKSESTDIRATDLDEAIRVTQIGLTLTPEGPGQTRHRKALPLALLGYYLSQRYRWSSRLASDLDEAIRVTQVAAELALEADPDKATYRCLLGSYLFEKSSVTEALVDLEDAIRATQIAVDITPPGHHMRAERLHQLSTQFARKYQITDTITNLECAIRTIEMAIDETAMGSQHRIFRLRWLETLAVGKYDETNAIEDLEDLIRVYRMVVDVVPDDDDENRAACFASLGTHLQKRYLITGEKANQEEAIRVAQEAVNITTPGSSASEVYSKELGAYLFCQSLGIRSISDLKEAAIQITLTAVEAAPEDSNDTLAMLTKFMVHFGEMHTRDSEEVIEAIQGTINVTPACHPIRVVLYKYLADYLEAKYETTDDIADLDETIRVCKEAVDIAPKDHAFLGEILSCLLTNLNFRYKDTKAVTDLEDAIGILRMIIHREPEDNSTRSKELEMLASYLADKYNITGAMIDLEEAIRLGRESIHLFTKEEQKPRFSNTSFSRLGALLGLKYQRTHVMSDLEEAIEFTQTAIDEAPNRLNSTDSLYNLGSLLRDRFASTDSLADLEKAIQVTREAFNNRIPRQPIYLNSLSNYLCEKFERTGAMPSLEEAIRVAHSAVALASNGHPKRAQCLNTLGYVLHHRYIEFEAEADLLEAIRLMQEALESTPQDATIRALILNNLGDCFSDKYERTGAKADLDDAIRVAYATIDANPTEPWNHADALQSRGKRLRNLYSKIGVIDVLDKAICATKEAVEIYSGGPGWAEALDDLGLHLAERYRKTGEVTDMEEAIRVTRTAAVATPKGIQKARCLRNLALHLNNRYAKDHTIASLDEAIQATEAAVEATPEDHAERAEFLGELGAILKERFSSTNEAHDLQRAIICHHSALKQADAHLVTRIEAGIDVLQCCALNADWQQAYEALVVAVGLIPKLTARSLQNSDKQHSLSQVVGLASDAAAAAFNAGKEPHVALDLLEQGRGLLATSLEERRMDTLFLREKHPGLAEEFVRLQGELNLQVAGEKPDFRRDQGPPTFEVRTSQLYQADRAFDQLLVDIRSRPGFATFLLSPGADEMRAAATGGPIVVINVSEYRCHAILVERDRIRALALPNLKSSDIDEKTLRGNLGTPHVLVWLWDAVAKPVLDALGCTCCPVTGSWPHVWWIPTGSLSRFPLHAAGRHGEGEAVLDRVMSTYSSSVKAIIHGRRLPALETNPLAAPAAQALLVAMHDTPQYSPLHFADTEVAILRDICKAIPVSPVEPGRLRNDIITHLPHCCIFHFAGHAYTDGLDPSQSHMVVHDGKITVATLLEMNLRERSPFLAYLSACGTGRIKDDRFLDESVHLISACQLAGFRHVIGTLWEVNDRLCVEMARVTYEGIRDGGMTDESVCLGLHHASRKLRDSWLKRRNEGIDRKGGGAVMVSNEDEIVMASIRDASKGDFRPPRDVLLCPDDDEDDEGGPPPLWIPYVHFGV